MSTTPDEEARKWRRRLAFIYWSLSLFLFGIFFRLFSVPLDIVRASVNEPPPWFRWVALTYFVCAAVGAGVAVWLLWKQVRKLPPPTGS